MTAFNKAWNSITKAEMSCPFCGEPFDIYDIMDFDDSPGIEAFREYGCGAFKTPQKECKSDPINKAWSVVKEETPVSVSVGQETIEVSCMIDGELKRKRYSGYSKEEAEQKFRQEFGC